MRYPFEPLGPADATLATTRELTIAANDTSDQTVRLIAASSIRP
jgi:hypothetical protein